MEKLPWLLETEHGLDPEGLKKASLVWLENKDEDPDRLIYGRRIYADGSRSLTCPMIPYQEFIAEALIPVIKAYKAETE